MVPAVLALSLKVILLLVAHLRKWADSSWTAYVVIFCMHNLTEIFMLIVANSGEQSLMILRCYYVCSIIVMLYGLFYVSDTTRKHQRAVCQLASGVVVVMVLLVLFTDTVVSGSGDHSYSLRALKGDAFVLYRLSSLVMVLFVVVFLITNYRRTRSQEYLYIIFALTPLVIATTVVLLLLKTEYEINAVAVIPLMGTLFLLITLQGKRITNPEILTYSFAELLDRLKSRYYIYRHSMVYARKLVKDSDRYHEVVSTQRSLAESKTIRPLIQKAQSTKSANDDL